MTPPSMIEICEPIFDINTNMYLLIFEKPAYKRDYFLCFIFLKHIITIIKLITLVIIIAISVAKVSKVRKGV